jgi:hypothetical protein
MLFLKNKKMTEKKLAWLPELIRFGGAITGIVLTAIGGVMLLNATMKLYVFNFQTEPYQIVSSEECRYDHNRRIEEVEAKEITRPYKRTAEEIEVCKKERFEENKIRFERSKKENMVDGLAMLLVGIPFWIIFWKKRKGEK